MDPVMRRDDLLQWCICKGSNEVKTQLNWQHKENKSYYGQITIYLIIKLFLIRESQHRLNKHYALILKSAKAETFQFYFCAFCFKGNLLFWHQ